MNREETKEAIKVMQHYAGGGEVEHNVCRGTNWYKLKTPCWNWETFNYRIKQEPMSVDWSHVREDIVAIAAHSNGVICGYEETPRKIYGKFNCWSSNLGYHNVEVIASLKRGTVPWDESLIIRPGYKG